MNVEIHDVMTIDEACLYLRIPRSSLYKLAQEGKIPCQKVGRHWRFHRQAIEEWIMGIYVPASIKFKQQTENSG